MIPEIPLSLWLAAPKDVTWWMAASRVGYALDDLDDVYFYDDENEEKD